MVHVQATLHPPRAELAQKAPETEKNRYTGALGGPRLVLQAGDKVELTLINNLEDRDNTGEWNQPRKPNTTNLHLHGMHVSGRAPADATPPPSQSLRRRRPCRRRRQSRLRSAPL